MAEQVSDRTLLERFIALREEEAFITLVRRHGPAVVAVCRRFLRNEHDVEDVFQSTFLVLAAKAPGIRWQDSAEGWIRNVARRLALHARSRVASRASKECSLAAMHEPADGGGSLSFMTQEPDPGQAAEQRELRLALNLALEELPEKYRAPVVLCYLEGKTNAEAARQLGWPTGSMSRRLERGRALLMRRLALHGVPLAVCLLGISVALLQSVSWISRPLGSSHARLEPIRVAMVPWSANQPPDHEDSQRLLRNLVVGEESPSSLAQVERLAGLASRTAIYIEDFNPGRDRALWRELSGEMRRSASALAQSARSGDRLAMVAAARRLDTTCVRCHTAFPTEASFDRVMDGP